MFILDTNVVSELRKVRSGRAHPAVADWSRSVLPGQLFLSAITVLELELGVLLLARRDPEQAAPLRAWLDHAVLPTFAERVLPIDATVALRCAAMHLPYPQSERDALIAATALVHGMAVVTRNRADFEATGVMLVDPWAFLG